MNFIAGNKIKLKGDLNVEQSIEGKKLFIQKNEKKYQMSCENLVIYEGNIERIKSEDLTVIESLKVDRISTNREDGQVIFKGQV